MSDPIKIVFRYKNNNRKIQYNVYIFVGEIPTKISSILESFRLKPLYDTLTNLSKEDRTKLEKHYGVFWYKKFFLTEHIVSTFNTVYKTSAQQKVIKDMYGEDWYNKHIADVRLAEKKIYYTYGALIKTYKERQELSKGKKLFTDEDEFIDYKTTDNRVSEIRTQKRMVQETVEQEGGTDDNGVDGYEFVHAVHKIQKKIGGGLDVEELSDAPPLNDPDTDKDGDIEFDEGVDADNQDIEEEDMSLEDMEKVYQDMDVNIDTNITKTTDLIKDALGSSKAVKKITTNIKTFDISKDDVMYDEQLKNVVNKHYVTNNYIFKDDTVKVVKDKVCSSVLNNSKFGDNSYIPPSRQYMWSEYYYNDNVEQIMIGQKWMRRTELLSVDTVPNSNIRIYEELQDNLKTLKDNLKRYGSRIHREDDNYNILLEYENYYTNNEIFMIDVYNELGKDYRSESKNVANLRDLYFKVYFPNINPDDIPGIIDYINGKESQEFDKISTVYENINNDLLVENGITNIVETTKKNPVYRSIFKENYITQSTIHLLARYTGKIDMFRIFNEFTTSTKYPFIQYHTMDGQIIFKYDDESVTDYISKKQNVGILSKWFENAPYGISFKVVTLEKDVDKFMAINLSETGRIEYKKQWKEDDKATVEDIETTYEYVRDLIKKLNSEKNLLTIDVPENGEFRYAFINSIQKFELPEKFRINHNDLSEFARYFYPYISLVIEPRKRQSKTKQEEEYSKYGTYLRYKRVSKYENVARIEQRILYFMRNYSYTDKSLALEIGKQFNITTEKAMDEIDRVTKKYPNIKKSRKILKKLENIPKYKPPGVQIDIQGKTKDKYKIRIHGAKDVQQLDGIIKFMNILIYLYSETYLHKRKDMQFIKEQLKKLTNVAKRRYKVSEIVNYDKTDITVKSMTKLDKNRLGFKPEKGQNQWTRSCQNSGTDKRRRPVYYVSDVELTRAGFKLNKKTNLYEKSVTFKSRNKTKTTVIKAVGLKGSSDTAGTVYYSCNPKDNGEHMYIGFLSKSTNPYGQPMPCCFIKDQSESTNKAKKNFFYKSLGDEPEDIVPVKTKKPRLDKLYILQDTNKIQDGKLGILPAYLDVFLNQLLNKSKNISNNYLDKADKGYYFKYGTSQETNPFIDAVTASINVEDNYIIDKIVSSLENDKNGSLFTSLNNGDIRTQFLTVRKFINYINTNSFIGHELLAHIMSIPNILKPNGLNIVIFDKLEINITNDLEKQHTIDDFVILCTNSEEVDSIKDSSRDTIILIKEDKNYYPIMFVKKTDKSKDATIDGTYKLDNNDDNIVKHIQDFYSSNCSTNLTDIVKNKKYITAKDIINILKQLNKDYHPKHQIIDSRNKCRYIITNNMTIIPVTPSGGLYNVNILKNLDSVLNSVEVTVQKLSKLYNISNKKISVNPTGVYYKSKTDKSVTVSAVATEFYMPVPTKDDPVSLKWITDNKLEMKNRQLYDEIDDEIVKGKSNFIIDDRIKEVNYREYMTEAYQLFRLELSSYLNDKDNISVKNKLKKIVDNKKIDKNEKKDKIREILFRLVDVEYKSNVQKGGKHDKFVHIVKNIPNLDSYSVKNNRDLCVTYPNKDECTVNPHCYWTHDNCYNSMTKDMIVKFINRLSDEMVEDVMNAYEILNEDGYYVSDILSYDVFTGKEGQTVVKSTNYSINKVLANLFGSDNVPIVGKRRGFGKSVVDIDQLNLENPLRDYGDMYIQPVISNNMTLFRAYTNSYIWLKQSYYDMNNRNLGYYSDLQTTIAVYFRGSVVEWLLDKNNYSKLKDSVMKYMKSDTTSVKQYAVIIAKNTTTNTVGIVELYVLNQLYSIPVAIHNSSNELLFIIDDKVYDKDIPSKYKDIKFLKNVINIRYTLTEDKDVPTSTESVYYK